MRALTKEQYEYLSDFIVGIIEYQTVDEFQDLTYELIREGWLRLVTNADEEIEEITDSGRRAVRAHQAFLATQ